MDAATVEELHAEYLAAKERNRVLTERYNREYKAGKWSTNRPLAGKCEDAYSEEYRAMRAWEAARDAAEAVDTAVDGCYACEDCGQPLAAGQSGVCCAGCQAVRHAAGWRAAVTGADSAPLDCPHEFVPTLGDRCGKCGESEHRVSVESRDYGSMGCLRSATCACGWATKQMCSSAALDTLIRVHRG